MNPLSGLNLPGLSQFNADALMAQANQGLAAKAIPAAELGKLTPQSDTAPLSLGGSGGSFSNVLGQMVQEVNAKQTAAGDSLNLLTGQNVSLHQAMISMEEANVSFQLMVQVRNKLLEAYQELMRMQV